MPRSPFDDDRQRFAAGRHGLWLFLASLAMLFLASIVGFVVLRVMAPEIEGLEWPRDLPPLPGPIWVSTVILAVSSGTVQWALASARRDRPSVVPVAMLATLGLALAFLAVQSWCAWTWLQALGDRWSDEVSLRFALSAYYVLTGLHAAHVVGGLPTMLVVLARSLRGAYTAEAHAGVYYCAVYWHFLGVVWVALFATLLLGI